MDNFPIRPTEGRLIIKQKEVKETAGEMNIIYVPEETKQKQEEPLGTIVAMGPILKDHTVEFKEGDFVMFDDHSGKEIKCQQEGRFKVMKHSDIIAIINGDSSGNL